MGDHPAITDRGVEGRATGYGDRVVAQLDAASKPAAGVTPGATPATPSVAPLIAPVNIFDPKKVLGGSLGNTVAARLEKELNQAHRKGVPAGEIPANSGVQYEVRYQRRWSTRDERFKNGKLEFPVYLLNAHTSDATPWSQIRDLMIDHGLIDSGPMHKLFETAESGWGDVNVEGLGLPPLAGYHKVGFVKADRVQKSARDLESGFVNVIKHELGHMHGYTTHTAGSVMREKIMITAGFEEYPDACIARMVGWLNAVKGKAEADLEAAYRKQNL